MLFVGCIPGEKFFTAAFQAISSIATDTSDVPPVMGRMTDSKLQIGMDMKNALVHESKLNILGAVFYFVKREWDPAAVCTTPVKLVILSR